MDLAVWSIQPNNPARAPLYTRRSVDNPGKTIFLGEASCQ